ncbi:MAG: Uma2 family endonuclease [Armatimonadetes bacterium]|nr:Uma2 family endonuclease [Armatimonadota bacterium]
MAITDTLTAPIVASLWEETASDLVTVEDFYALVEDGQKADLIDGVIYMASPDNYVSNDIGGFLYLLLRCFCEAMDVGIVVVSRFAFRLSDFNAPEPDVAYVSRDRQHLVHANGMDGGPDIAIEIVSRDSRHRDYFDKKQLYEKAGVPEYWIIDPLQRRAEFYRMLGGRYELVPLEQNSFFRSDALKGFWIDVEWLFADPLPKAMEKLRLILGGDRA